MWKRPEYAIGVWVMVWLLNAVAAVVYAVPKVEAELTQAVGRKLKEDALQNWKFQVVGMDVILIGPKPILDHATHPEEPAAKSSVLGVPGVREVIEVRYPSVTSSQRSTESFWFEIRRNSSEVWIYGDFADHRQKDHATLPLLEWFGDMNVNDATSIDQQLSTPFDPARAVQLQNWMAHPDVPSFMFRFEKGVVTVEASVSSQGIAEAIRKQVRIGFPKVKLNDQIKVGGQKPRGQLEIDDLKKYNRPLEKLFAGDSLSEDGKAYLSRVAPVISAIAGKVKVGVHVDPTQSQPEAWSRRRANEIKDFLVTAGASPSQLQAEGFGAKIPNPGGARRRVTFEAVSL